MNSLLRFLPILTLAFLTLFLSPGVFAQGLNDNSYSNPQPYTIDGTNNLTATIGNTTVSSFNLDWRWALPLLVVASGVYFLRGSRQRADRNFYHPGRDYTVAYHDIRKESTRKNNQVRRLKKPLKAA